MSASKSSPGLKSATVRDRLADWRQLLDRCGRKPTRRRVHALRVVTLRLLAELERDAAELPSASHQAQAILRFGKLAARMRRVLRRVRELDVWIGKLRGLRTSMDQTAAYVPRSSRDCIRQIQRTEARLREKRRLFEKKLLFEIERRKGQLQLAGEEVHAAVEVGRGEPDSKALEPILARFAAIAAEFSTLNTENLHEFRKRIKTVRYLAEISGGDPGCDRIAGQMRKMQTAIGEWHDWQALAREVSREQRKRNGALADLLDALTAEAFDIAIASCHSITARLLAGRGTSNGTTPAMVRGLPPGSVQPPVASAQRKLA